jgi:hypothetical protein
VNRLIDDAKLPERVLRPRLRFSRSEGRKSRNESYAKRCGVSARLKPKDRNATGLEKLRVCSCRDPDSASSGSNVQQLHAFCHEAGSGASLNPEVKNQPAVTFLDSRVPGKGFETELTCGSPTFILYLQYGHSELSASRHSSLQFNTSNSHMLFATKPLSVPVSNRNPEVQAYLEFPTNPFSPPLPAVQNSPRSCPQCRFQNEIQKFSKP